MSRYSIVITTAPRPGGVTYLKETMMSLTKGGVFRSPLLGYFGICPTGERDILQNLIHALEEARKMETEWSIIMADDVRVIGNFLESVNAWLQCCAAPEIPFYPLGANFGSVEHPQIAWQYHMVDFYGAQCFCINRTHIQSLIDRLRVTTVSSLPDIQVGEWASSVGAPYVLTPCPSFIQHIGEVSTQPNTFFDFPSWPGEEWTYTTRACVFSSDNQRSREKCTSTILKDTLASTLDPNQPVYDFGCSSGLYLKHLQSKGFQVLGLEGTPRIGEISGQSFIQEFDLLHPVVIDPPGQVMCLEVLEHIPEAFEEVVVQSLVSSCGGRLVVSWALPGQGGRGHINERPPEYIQSVFGAHGYVLNEALTTEYRQAGKDLKWFLKSIYVFEK